MLDLLRELDELMVAEKPGPEGEPEWTGWQPHSTPLKRLHDFVGEHGRLK